MGGAAPHLNLASAMARASNVLGMMGTFAVPPGALMSKPLQTYLGNQLLKRPPPLLGDKPMGGLMRLFEQEQAAQRAARQRCYAGGHYAE